jgi:quinol monooxygenase YgiN
MSGFVIVVDFRLKPGSKAAFRRLIDDNARASCRDEPGCRRFDVLEPAGEADRIVLYEIYDDRAAFDAHIKTRHFAQFNETSAALVSAKVVTECGLVCEGSAA